MPTIWTSEGKNVSELKATDTRMVTISKEIQFDAGHRVPNHKSKCRNPHGHRYRVEVFCEGAIITTPGASDEGMLIDFSDLKDMMMKLIHDPLDHGFIVWEHDGPMNDMLIHGDPDWKIIDFETVPTAENIAIWCWQQLKPVIDDRWHEGGLRLDAVKVWETPTSMAIYDGI